MKEREREREEDPVRRLKIIQEGGEENIKEGAKQHQSHITQQ